jgi:membrane protease YdiL (CAAX protease family)
MTGGLATAAALVAYNTVTNIGHDTDRGYVLRNVTAGAVLVGLARRRGLTWWELGLRPADLRSGWLWGGVVASGIAGTVVLTALRARRRDLGHRLLSDRRAELDSRELAWQTLVRIPVGTAGFEEVAFRSVLFAVLHRAGGWPLALVGSSAAFGLWHIGPTLAALRLNNVRGHRIGPTAAAVVATTAAGVGFGVLRLLSGHVVACWLAHWASNAVGLASATWWQQHNRRHPAV